MCTCMYCGKCFKPRPQVKNPKACKDPKCQKKRQRSNEKAWRVRNQQYYPRKYYQKKKQERIEYLKSKACEVFKAFVVGLRFSGVTIHEPEFLEKWILFFLGLGKREVKKLWVKKSVEDLVV